MADVAALWRPEPGERELLAHMLGDRAAWWVDGPVPDARVALTFFPRRELQALHIGWDAMPKLELVQSCTAGLNHIGWADMPDVQVAAAPGATGPFIAEYVLGAIIAWARGFWRHTRAIGTGDFQLGAPVRSLRSLRVGLVGYGGIGQAVARLLARDGCTVEAVSRSGEAPAGDTLLEQINTMDRLHDMVRRVDVLVLCLPLTADTEGLIDIDVLSGMTGRSVLLVNVARGAIVDEGSLYAWLDASHTKHGAVLDVWWQYPRGEGKPYSHSFETLPNVIMTPHNSPNVEGFRLAMLEQACTQVQHFLDTGKAQHVHDRTFYATSGIGDGR